MCCSVKQNLGPWEKEGKKNEKIEKNLERERDGECGGKTNNEEDKEGAVTVSWWCQILPSFLALGSDL